MLSARRELSDALSAMEVFPLGPDPNTFGTPTGTLAEAEKARDDYNDRSNIGVHTSDGWTLFGAGTGNTLDIGSRATFPSAPWGAGPPWVWPTDVSIVYKGTPISYSGVRYGGMSYSGINKNIRVSMIATTTITTVFGDPVDVVIPGADWGGRYADGRSYIQLLHSGGPTYQHWDGRAWVSRLPQRKIDADILGDRPAGMPSRRWVRVGAMSSLIEPRVFTGTPVGYSADVDIEIEIGSGPAHSNPDEADELAYRTLDEVLDIIGTIPKLTGTGRLSPVEHNTIEGWADGDRRETILGLTVRVTSR